MSSLEAVQVCRTLIGHSYKKLTTIAGGGPLAARLALNGHKTLLIEAGDDQGESQNYTVPAFNAKVSEDPNMTWDFFVHHYADEDRQSQDFKTTYATPDGGEYTGLNPPEGSTQKGTLYPRAGTLGGCTAHNALIAVYPHQSDFEYIQNLTGDDSWSPDNMRDYFVKLESNNYLTLGKAHGYDGWLGTEYAPIDIVTSDPQLLSLVSGAAWALGNDTNVIVNLATLLAGDANAGTDARDSDPGLFQIPLSTADGQRTGSREFVVAVRDAKFDNGTQKYPLDVKLNTYVTKVTFDETTTPPTATGVEFREGQYLYKASPKNTGAQGTAGSATASREVIVAGGTYNSPQILKLSGVGPADELQQFDIPVIVDLPGVGTNLQDHYEISVQGTIDGSFSALDGCTFQGDASDACIDRYNNDILGNRGIYASPGLGANMYYPSSVAENGDWDIFAFGGPINFRGYFPDYSVNATDRHDFFTWAILKAHPRNHAGTVLLQSADPFDTPAITYNYFDTGVGDWEKDVTAMQEAIALARDAFDRQLVPVTEVLPGADVTTDAQLSDYIRNNAWGHHCSSTCPIGADDDEYAVLDSSFNVRGTQGLRVVDASVYPRIPGTFTALSTYMIAEKAADVILAAAAEAS